MAMPCPTTGCEPTADLGQERAGVAGAFARQSRLPRAGFAARAYGTDNVRPAAVVNRVCTYQLVTFETAARHGEPFAVLTRATNMLPNPAARLCTINLKMRASSAYMRDKGFEEWDSVMGIRADEPRRVARMMDPARDNSNGVPVLPLARANVTKADVLSFWRTQPFDLQLDPQGDFGNCDCCFLKARHKIVRALVAEPWRADWWIEQESAKHGATFRNDRPRYADLKREALFYARQIPLDLEYSDDAALIDCFCGD
jgi:3'-phosphoadenosine 5'-phosphosulfate sulfotransferase (PAPS reductase)/FAD synthetase